ncbi:hypothetical protein I312_101570 [Cryptococcus bacillisporus CA1280]|uniref:uncharacterized protein n=1 Tax=Cryptococcus bacillisporus CA1280 TaxID=1296109 RepID=UPI003365D9C2
MSLRAISLRRLPRYNAVARPLFSRLYATPGSPKPSQNPPPPPGLESVFGGSPGKPGTTVAPKPPGVGPPSGPSLPKKPDVGLPGLEGEENRPEDQKEPDEPRRPKLSEQLSGKAGKKVTTGGGGGGGGGAGGPGGQPGGFGGMTPNQLLLLAISTYALWSMTAPDDVRTKEITWQEFRNSLLARGLVSSLEVVNRNKVRVHLHNPLSGQPQQTNSTGSGSLPSPSHGPAPYQFTIGSLEAFENLLIASQDELGIPPAERVPVSYREEISTFQTIMHFAPTLLIAGLLLWMARRGGSAMGGGGPGGGIFGVGKSRAKMFNKDEQVSVRFKDVAGMDEAKEEIMEFVKFLKEPLKYEKLGAKIPRGAILSGPPGTGKTLLAKATAGEAGVPFLSVSGSEFVEMFVGVGPSRIFAVHLKPITLAPDLTIERIAEKLALLTPGFSGADIANVCNEAALRAARHGGEVVTEADFDGAIERVIAGLERKSRVLGKDEKRTVAYHEAGHAVCGWFLEHADPLLKVSIIPRGVGALGYAQYLPKERFLFSTEQLLDRMSMTLGGRVAEEIFFGRITTGAQDDLQKITKMAFEVCANYGMDPTIGPVSYGGRDQQGEGFQKPFSEATAEALDKAVKKMVIEAHDRTTKLLTKHKEDVEKVAKLLLVKEVITREDMRVTLGPRPFANKDEMDDLIERELDKKKQENEGQEADGPVPQLAFKPVKID